MTTYEKLRFQARLILSIGTNLGVPENLEVPISSIRANHDENGIPFCVVSVATGRDVNYETVLKGLSPLYTKGNQIRLPTRASLLLKVTMEDKVGDTSQTWPEDWFEAFDGWVADVAPSLSMGSSSTTIRLVHWLADLDFSSPYSEDAFPTTPADFLFSAATVHGTGIARPIVGSTALSVAVSRFNATSVTTDFWDTGDSGLRPFLEAVASERLMNWQQIQRFTNVAGQQNVPRVNNLMTTALERFEPFLEDDGFTYYTYGSPIQLRGDLNGVNQIASKIALQAALAARSPMFIGSTMWDRMISGMTSQYMFSIIPMTDRALTVPYVPWQKNTWVTIHSNEFDVIEYSLQSRRPIRAVAVIATYGSQTGLRVDQQAGGPTNGQRQVMGYYEPQDSPVNGSRNGMTMYVEAPAWINDLVMHTGVSNLTAPADAKIPFAGVPGVAVANQALQTIIREKSAAATALATALAKATYLQETTKWRQMVISTALRFDISPGSSIRIFSSPDRMVNEILNDNELPIGEEMVGRVVRVSWTLDLSGQSPTAATVFHLAYLRSAVENDDSAFAADDHPLWSTTWTGAPLVGRPEFSH